MLTPALRLHLYVFLLKSNAFHIRYLNSQIFALTQNSEVSENCDTDITVSTTNRSLLSLLSYLNNLPSLIFNSNFYSIYQKAIVVLMLREVRKRGELAM